MIDKDQMERGGGETTGSPQKRENLQNRIFEKNISNKCIKSHGDAKEKNSDFPLFFFLYLFNPIML